LSGGQQQRVAVARALAREPRLLLLDEPFSAVDQMNRQGLYRLLADLRRELAVPIVLVTHDLNEARLLADRLVVMDAGQVLQQRHAGIHPPLAAQRARVADLVGIANRWAGWWEGGDGSEPGWGWLRWGEGAAAQRLRVRDKGRIDMGQRVSWVVPGEGLHLCSLDAISAESPTRPPKNGLELSVRLSELRHLGEVWLLHLRCETGPPAVFRLMLTGPQVLPLQTGQALRLCLDLDMVHIMPVRTGAGTALPGQVEPAH
jgi:molybdate transport system ATP-binding protein